MDTSWVDEAPRETTLLTPAADAFWNAVSETAAAHAAKPVWVAPWRVYVAREGRALAMVYAAVERSADDVRWTVLVTPADRETIHDVCGCCRERCAPSAHEWTVEMVQLGHNEWGARCMVCGIGIGLHYELGL